MYARLSLIDKTNKHQTEIPSDARFSDVPGFLSSLGWVGYEPAIGATTLVFLLSFLASVLN